jgi:hypothetical protein
MPEVPGYLSAATLNTSAAQKLKASLEKRAARKYTAAPKKKRKSEKTKKAKAEPHASAASIPKGVLAKDAYYAQNGHDYIEGQASRNKVYKKVDAEYASLAGLLEDELEPFEFPNLKYPENFNPGAKVAMGARVVATFDKTRLSNIAKRDAKRKKTGSKAPDPANQYFPYAWEAHHMLPGSAFYYEDAQGHCFEPWQIQLILRSDYNINHGHNIIFLPDESWAVPIHRMIQHPGDHPVYTQEVMKNLRRIAQDLEGMRDKKAKHPELKAAMFERLKNLEDEQWTMLVSLGREVTSKPGLVNKPWVTYGTKDDPDKFNPWGALY